MNLYDTYRLRGLRAKLVQQLREKEITDENVLEAIDKVPRHFFFKGDSIFYETHAYEDKAFPIGAGQTISQPYTVAFQTQLLRVKPDDKILEIGTGSGYQAAILMYMGARVYTIERQGELFRQTEPFLKWLHEYLKREKDKDKPADNSKLTWRKHGTLWPVRCYFGDGFEGLPHVAPFDKIIITAAVSELPGKLLQQLHVKGVIVLPFGAENNCRMLRITKHGEDQYETEEFGAFRFVPMLKGKVQ
ncbi:MAG: protein-L-isoaspartate O-methyltransferase [Chitinophagales bacterium]|nr:protein-L-isoaspartate O-methyltransferase [Chitinophagales bacterium]MDW8417900.1 protein-L-isoaspartate O-methyltransferase [Chitinophagales bacterium]